MDCGGDCEACITCDDGVQNGDEEGIDCGGTFCASCDDGGSGSEVFAHYFETGWDGWLDGGSDCYRYSGLRAYEGNFAIRLRDNSGLPSTMTSPVYDLTGYTGVEVNFYFYPSSMEPGEDFWLRYYDGFNWQTVASFTSGSSFNNNSFYVATVPILASNHNMSEIAKFRFQCDASSNADRIYIDAVTVTGLNGSNLIDEEIKISQLQNLAEIDQYDFIEDVQISPNPTVSQLRVKMNLEYDQVIKYEIIDVFGRSIHLGLENISHGLSSFGIDVDQLNTGTYLLRITDADNDQSIKKFIKLN